VVAPVVQSRIPQVGRVVEDPDRVTNLEGAVIGPELCHLLVYSGKFYEREVVSHVAGMLAAA
jgi:hypothetical protein